MVLCDAERSESAAPPRTRRRLELLVDGGQPIGRPAAVESEGNTDWKPDRGDRLPGEVLGIEDDDVAEVALRVVDVGQDPAFVLGDGTGLSHEDGLGCHPAAT